LALIIKASVVGKEWGLDWSEEYAREERGRPWDVNKLAKGSQENGLVPAAIFGLDVILEFFVHLGHVNEGVNSLNRRNKQDLEEECE
jgi:hypothetical protein